MNNVFLALQSQQVIAVRLVNGEIMKGKVNAMFAECFTLEDDEDENEIYYSEIDKMI